VTGWLRPHRVVLLGLAAALLLYCVLALRWDWLAEPRYQALILRGIWTTIWLLLVTSLLGLILAIALGFAQAAGPWWLAAPAAAFCTVIRGTPLLLQLWLLYFGLGSLFPAIPWIRDSALWPILRQAWPYAVLALTLSYAGYGGEVMRGAFRSVPHGQLEAARSMGMPRFTLVRRIWLPQAISCCTPRKAANSSSSRRCFCSSSLAIKIFMAVVLLACCERSFWHWTTIPVAKWVIRTAESVLFTCWPPAPPALNVSILISSGFTATSSSEITSGITSTEAKEVWRRLAASNGEIRTRR